MPRLSTASASTSRDAPYPRRAGPRVQPCDSCKLNRHRCVLSEDGGPCERCSKRREDCTFKNVAVGEEGIRNAYSKLLSMSARLAALEAALGERIRQQALTVSKDQARESTIVTIRDAQEDAWLDAPLDPGEGYWSRPEVLASRDSVVAALGHIHVPAPTSYTSSSSHSTTHSDDERSRATVSTAATSPRWSECSTLPPSPSESPRVNPRSSFDHDLLASFDHPCLPLSPPRKSLVFPPSPLLIPIPLPLRLPVPESSPLLDLCDISTNLDNSRIGARVSFERAACGA